MRVGPHLEPTVTLNYSYKIPVVATTTLVTILLILAAYFTDRGGGVDEIGLFNPPYMALHFNKITYPMHRQFNNMVVHPPVHYEMIALMMRLGFNSYYAEATPTLFMLVLAVLLIAFGPFPGPVKIGLLYGVWVSMTIFSRASIEMFGMRPEGDVAASWLAGLVALESARLEKWNLKKLFLGALLLTYAASLHYYAVPGVLGVAVYLIWAVWQLGFRRALKPCLALAGGGLLFGAPYLFLFILPNREAISEMVRGTQTGGGGVQAIVQEHFSAYKFWASVHIENFLLHVPFSLGIPVVFFSTPVLLAIRSTRGIALAALPLELFLLLFAWHKLPPYYTHEIGLYSSAAVAGTLTLADRLVPKLRWRRARYLAWGVVTLAMGIGWWQLGKWRPLGRRSDLLTLSTHVRVHEMEIGRAVAIEMLGPGARVASRIGSWYASGASYLHDPSPDVIWPVSLPKGFEPYYFSQFDAVAENPHMSYAAGDRHMALLSWYLNGTLKLRGFFFAGHNDGLNYGLFTAKQPVSVMAFALDRSRLYRFAEAAAGGHEMVTFVTPAGATLDSFCARAPFYSLMELPKSQSDEGQQIMVAALVPAGALAKPLPSSRIMQRIRGSLQLVDWHVMLDKMQHEDRPIRFYERYQDMPGVSPFNPGTSP